jgi:hypothetical protein
MAHDSLETGRKLHEQFEQVFRPAPPLPDLAGVEAALAEYDAVPWGQLWDCVDSNDGVKLLEADEQAAFAKVRAAFAEATKDRNTTAQCKAVTLDYLRQIVARWRKQ